MFTFVSSAFLLSPGPPYFSQDLVFTFYFLFYSFSILCFVVVCLLVSNIYVDLYYLSFLVQWFGVFIFYFLCSLPYFFKYFKFYSHIILCVLHLSKCSQSSCILFFSSSIYLFSLYFILESFY